MTPDDIIRLARECKLHLGGPPVTPELERFYRAAYAAGAAAERDRWSRLLEGRAAGCERAAENTGDPKYDSIARTLMSVREEGLK